MKGRSASAVMDYRIWKKLYGREGERESVCVLVHKGESGCVAAMA